MKFNIIILILITLLFGCSMHNPSDNYIEKEVSIININRDLISGLTSPVVDYILFKDGELYNEGQDVSLLENSGTYTLQLNLITGSNYNFTTFTIKSNNIVEYILDQDLISNNDGFTISIDGVFSVPPKVFLKKVTGVIYENVDYENLSVDVVTDESSYLDPVPLTFKVSSNIPGAVFKVYKYTIYWVSGPILNQGEIFDMDTGNIFDPLIDGDEDPWGSGKFKIETTNSIGDTVFIVGFSEEWSEKYIHLVLD